jgi:hypothetical protein
MEPHIKAISDALAARRDDCDAMVCCMSAPEVMQYTRMGRFTMDGEPSGPIALLKRLRGTPKDGKPAASGERQLADVTSLATHTSVYSRDCSRCQGLLPHTAILARWI